MSGFGTPDYDGNASWNLMKLKTDKNGGRVTETVRILPPMHELADKGKWAIYCGIHFGWRGVHPTKPDKTKLRPFRAFSTRNFKTGENTHQDPILDEQDRRKEEMQALERQYIKEGKSEKEIGDLLAPYKHWLREHNTDWKWRFHVMTKDGQFGVFLISNTLKKKLNALIDKLRDRNIDPLALDQGVWFTFSREGFAPKVDDDVDVEYEEVKASDGTVAHRVKMAPLSEDQQRRALEVCPGLTKSYQEITEEQMRMLVESGDDPEEVDAIMNMGVEAKEETPEETASPVPTVTVPPPAPEPESEPKPAVEAKPSATPSKDDEIAALQAKLAALQQAEQNSKPAPADPQVSTVQVPEGHEVDKVENIRDMPDDQFMSMFQTD